MRQTIRILVALAVCAAVAPAMADVTSPYYLFNGDADVAQVVQGSSIVDSWTTSGRLYPLAVADTVRGYPIRSPGPGVEYTLAGAPTGNTYPWTPGPTGQLLDGTTDGVAHNYATDWAGTNVIWQYDRDWQNPVQLFGVQGGRPIGLTYDRTDGTFWVAIDGVSIDNYDAAGNLLSSFSSGNGRIASLAWEPATDTLWGYVNGTGQELRNWAKDGTLLETLIVPGISRNTWGGEFVMVPEPSCDPCDTNCDDQISAFDIEPFLNLLFDPDTNPCCGERGDTGSSGDTNGDGEINSFDIEPFLECLFP